MKKDWQQYLQSLGLTENEAKVYLVGLEEGPQSVQVLAKQTKLSRVTVYAIIESLTRFGLMTSVQKGKKHVYAVEPPERLITFGQQQAQKMESVVEEMQKRIQELKLVASGDKPVVRLFEGKEAFQFIQDDFLESGATEIREFGNLDQIVENLDQSLDLNPFYEDLDKKGVVRKLVYATKKDQLRPSTNLKKIVKLPGEADFFGDIFLYDDRVALSDFHDHHIVVIIESKVVAETIRKMFDLLWKKLEK